MMHDMAIEITPFDEAAWPDVWSIIQEVASAGETFTYPRDISEELARRIWIQAEPAHTVIASASGDGVIGTARMGPNQMGPGAHVATASFMVKSSARGRGAGRALGQYAIEWAERSGFRSMQFNAVVETNERAVALWKSLGFSVIGTVPEAFAHPALGYVGLHIMHRPLCQGLP